MRLKLGDMAQATVFNDDPAAQAQSLRAQGFRLAASRRSRRRLCRQAGQRDGGRGDPRSGHDPGAARRRHSRPGDDRDVARTRRRAASSWAPSRCAIRISCEACRDFSGPDRRRHRCEGADKVAVEGWAETSELGASIWPALRAMRASPRSSSPTSIATACCVGLNIEVDTSACASGRCAGHCLGRARLDGRYEAPRSSPIAHILEGAITGRALYDGRLDASEALRLIREAA